MVDLAKFFEFLRRYCHVEGFGETWNAMIRRQLADHPDRAEMVRAGLTDAIVNHTISLEQYEKLTQQDFDSQADLAEWLRHLWREMFDDPAP